MKPGIERRLGYLEIEAILAGAHSEADVADCLGFVYKTLEDAERYAETNRTRYGHTVVGPSDLPGLGPAAVVVLTDAIAEAVQRSQVPPAAP